jgi:hypothetical protein
LLTCWVYFHVEIFHHWIRVVRLLFMLHGFVQITYYRKIINFTNFHKVSFSISMKEDERTVCWESHWHNVGHLATIFIEHITHTPSGCKSLCINHSSCSEEMIIIMEFNMHCNMPFWGCTYKIKRNTHMWQCIPHLNKMAAYCV